MLKSVQIAGSTYEIQRFKGLKAIMAIAAVARISEAVPNILADAAKKYNQRNTIVITEAMSRLPRWAGFTSEDFDAAESRTGKRELEIPAPVAVNEQIMQSLPALLEQARKEVIRLLAILIIPNEKLKEADKNDQVEAALDEYYEPLMYDADLSELAELAIAASDVLKAQLADKGELGNLLRGLWKRIRSQQPQSTAPTPTSEMTTEQLEREAAEIQATSTPESPTSSTPSPSTTDGAETRSSMVSTGPS